MKLKDRVAVVTGGGTGVGRATCLALANEGAKVVASYSRSHAGAEEVVREIRSGGGEAVAIRADVTSDAEVRTLMDGAAERFGRLDFLVNNAGWTRRVEHADLDGLTEEIMDRVLAVNVKGPIFCARAAIPHMRRNGGGSIVNVTSVAGVTGAGSSILYGGSKAALATITKSLARAFAPEVRVNAVAPGFIDTGFGDWPPGTAEAVRDRSHIGRGVTPEDVAATVLFLLTDGSALTGQEIVVDGGTVALGVRE
jgi:3-oxoacyl-[acyl-carrier protein] reductase